MEIMTPYLTIAHFQILILIFVLFAAAITDYQNQRIPNVLTFPAAFLAIGLHSFQNGIGGFLFGIYGMLAGTFLLIIPYMMGAMGAGDAKLMGAAGAFLGVKAVFAAFLLTAICGGVYAIITIFVRRAVFKGFFKEQYQAFLTLLTIKQYNADPSPEKGRPRLCYGIAIAMGTYIYIGLDMSNIHLF